MKNIILDTDFGIDCDDAIALAMLENLEKTNECRLLAVTVSTTRTNVPSSIRSVVRYYGGRNIPIGVYNGEPLPADEKNVYADGLAERFLCENTASSALSVFKETLRNAIDKVTIAVVGPQSNIAQLLQDEEGIALVQNNVEKIYIMGGCFNGSVPFEFNIYQDWQSARYVAEYCPVDIVYVSHEAACDILTGGDTVKDEYNPVGLAVRLFFAYEFPDTPLEKMARSSWDPVTALIAVRGEGRYYALSSKGQVDIQADGMHFTAFEQGRHIYVYNGNEQKLKSEIDDLLIVDKKEK